MREKRTRMDIMAKRRENTARQLSLFDVMASQMEELRTENGGVREAVPLTALLPKQEEAPAPEPVREAKPFSFPTTDASFKRLGVNGNGDSVYELEDGSRMFSPNLQIIQFMDGEKRTAEKLF